jgi:hypothetical protein
VIAVRAPHGNSAAWLMRRRIFIQVSDITTPGMVRLSLLVRWVSGRDPVANNAVRAAAFSANFASHAARMRSQ